MSRKPTPYIPSQYSKSKWTQEIEDYVFHLMSEKHMTGSQISDAVLKKFGVRFSRSAIIGKIHRVTNA